VSEGWVRCGRCQGVFNALESLFDVEPEPAVLHATAAPPALAHADQAASAETAAPIEPGRAEPAPTELVPAGPVKAEPVPAAAALWRPETAHTSAAPAEPYFEEPQADAMADDFDATPASRVLARDRIDFADARFNIALLAEAGIDTGEEPADPSASAAATSTLPQGGIGRIAPPLDGEIQQEQTPPIAAAAAPEFLRQAERQARWARPRTGVALSLLAMLLALALSLQAALHFRDLLAAFWPAARPPLEAMCEVVACRIDPLRRIDDVAIESSALTSAAGGDAVRLSVVLRNRGPLPLAVPAIELTLTDPVGRMLARRDLLPSDFGVAQPTLPPESESAMQLVLATGGQRASGYTVEPFYP
jgi:hypothetical protein